MPTDRVFVSEVRLDEQLVDHSDMRRVFLVSFLDFTAEQNGNLHGAAEPGTNIQDGCSAVLRGLAGDLNPRRAHRPRNQGVVRETHLTHAGNSTEARLE